ncbi:hypothetical protein GCM10011380_08940 [Sphingomonas metalli]|uniref:Uncharacterized protein n=1 Tax=Sphingomonas metalli TaxID=1779358 RepID=A0A916T030_9SPHN|nr:hypothetical protein [Sphingomonas metalli]GGB21567.1 hypothetical protein GCM10011380_08940 [Sphingomonas metalli]
MTEVVGGVLMAVGGGMLSLSSFRLLAASRAPVAEGVLAALPHTPVPADMPADMQLLLAQLD